jgi:cytochrome P450
MDRHDNPETVGTVGTADELYWDPFLVELNTDPYPLFRRLRDEAPLYYNERHDFYAVSRADDVERAFADNKRLINGRSDVLEFIKSGMDFPPGMFIFEDPPRHTKHRGLLSRVFTPKKMLGLEPEVRDFCARTLDPLVGSGGFDFVKDYAEIVSSRVIGLMLGIPEADQQGVRAQLESHVTTDKPREVNRSNFEGAMYAQYIDWRETHPSDDLMTAMLNVEFEDETGVERKLSRQEVLTFTTLLSGAGNDTTAKLIGWTGKLLSDHPDERRLLVDDPSLIPDAVEETLRYESPGMQNARYAAVDVEFDGGVVPAGSALVCIMASANRDERRFPDPDRFDVRRRPTGFMTFAFGAHFCLGAALARLQGRVALEEMLKRFPEWTVVEEESVIEPTSTTRGWKHLPIVIS